jgi:hypothetical protein
MKTFCETFNRWLYHFIDTKFICENRVKLSIPECLKCRGIISSIKKFELSKKPDPIEIYLSVDKDRWIGKVKEMVEEYNIQAGRKKDEISARRIANLFGEIYIKLSTEPTQVKLLRVMIVEKDMFDLATELRLECDPLECEERVKPHLRKKVLCTWGVDKTTGLEGYTSQLKEWTIEALKPMEEEYGRKIDFGSRSLENIKLEEIGIG